MKKFLLMFLLAAMPAIAQTDFKPVGKWEATDDDGQQVYIIFDAEGYVSLQKGEEILGGKHFEIDGMEGQMTYTFTPGTNNIDFIMKELSTGMENPMLGIYKVINKDEVIIAMGNSEERPEDFADDAITFKRVK